MTTLAAAAILAVFAGCGGNCAESVRLGDFERSQGNLEKALRHYERALETDAQCAGVEARMVETRNLLDRQPGSDP